MLIDRSCFLSIVDRRVEFKAATLGGRRTHGEGGTSHKPRGGEENEAYCGGKRKRRQPRTRKVLRPYLETKEDKECVPKKVGQLRGKGRTRPKGYAGLHKPLSRLNLQRADEKKKEEAWGGKTHACEGKGGKSKTHLQTIK